MPTPSLLRLAPPLLALAALSACGGGGGGDAAATPTPTPEQASYGQNLLRGLDRATVEKTRSDLLSIGTAITLYASQNGAPPQGEGLDLLAAAVSPAYIKRVPATDAWGQPLAYKGEGDTWTVTAPGPDGALDTADDIAFGDAGWTKLPEGYRPVF